MNYKIILGPVMSGDRTYNDGEIIQLSEQDATPLLEKGIIEATGDPPTKTPSQEQELKALQQQVQALQEQVNQKDTQVTQLQSSLEQKDVQVTQLQEQVQQMEATIATMETQAKKK